MKLLKRRIPWLLAVIAVVGSLLVVRAQGLSVASANAQLAKSKGVGQHYVPDEVLVRFNSRGSQDQSIASLGIQKIRDLDQSGWVHLKLPLGRTVEQTLAAYKNDPNVEITQPNYIYHTAAFPNDPNYAQQWALKNTGQIVSSVTQPGDSLYGTNNPGTPGADMGIEVAWDHITDCSSVTVAVVDSGVNYNHTDLASNMWNGGASFPNHGFNFVNNNNDPMDRNGHGTHVAGIIGAVGNDSLGTTGVCWKASIMAVRVLDAAGSGTSTTVIQGVNFAVANGAKVINMSLGGSSFDPAFSSAITNAQSSGVVVVVSAGNDASNNDSGTTPVYPCNFTQSNLICVAAIDQSYQLATFSNYGATSVDVGAPGTNILSSWAGTNASISDPLTSGWTFTTTTTGGWAFGSLLLGGIPTQFLLDPPNYPNVLYNSNTDDRASKTFNLAGVDVAVGQSFAAINVVNGDHFRVGYTSAGGDPFAGGGTIIEDDTGLATFPNAFFGESDISGCISATCSLGFQLQSGATMPKDLGVAITGFTIQTLTFDKMSYNTIAGTSMASPEVAGLATMLRAYNPQYTYTEVVNAIKNGGRAVAALAGETRSGKAADAMATLAYINPPTGLAASVQ